MTPQPVTWDYSPDSGWHAYGVDCPRCPGNDPYCLHPDRRRCPLDLRMVALHDRLAVGDNPDLGRC